MNNIDAIGSAATASFRPDGEFAAHLVRLVAMALYEEREGVSRTLCPDELTAISSVLDAATELLEQRPGNGT